MIQPRLQGSPGQDSWRWTDLSEGDVVNTGERRLPKANELFVVGEGPQIGMATYRYELNAAREAQQWERDIVVLRNE